MMDDEEYIIKRTRPYLELKEELEKTIKKLRPVKYRKRQPYEEQSTKQQKKFKKQLTEVLMEEPQNLSNAANLKIGDVRMQKININEENENIIDAFVEKKKVNHVQKSVYWKDKKPVSDKTNQSAITFAEFDLAP
jgi:CxxC motif-containing protein